NLKIDEDEIVIRLFEPTDPITEITKLLHRSYKQLADMGFRYLATHQDESETERRLNNGISYLALINDRIIGTVSLYYGRVKGHDADFYNKEYVAHFGQFAVDPEYQKKGIGNIMMDLIEEKAKSLGAKEIALDTADGAAHLIKYYEKREYRFIEHVNWKVTNYRSIIMSKRL
ncbi:MAG: GNAT family N-acetyltransferase, partial [bacterium]